MFATDTRGEALSATSLQDVAEVEASSFWFRSRRRLISWALRRYFPDAHSFLDVGCGTGGVLTWLRTSTPELNVVGSDLAIEGLTTARYRLPDVPLYVFDAMHIPFVDEFDVIGAFDLIEHVDDDLAVLRRIRAALRPSGGFLLTVPQHPWLWSRVDDHSGHRRRYTRHELLRVVERAGFDAVRVTSFLTLLLPVLALSRAAQRRRPLEPRAEHLAAERLDRVLERVQDLERDLIRFGLSFPMGGSLLVVAKRAG